MSESVRPHRRQPTRLPSPWDSPGKNTGVDCHFLLQCMEVKSESEVAQSCLTPGNPMDCSPPVSFVPWIFQARVLEWGLIAFSDASQYSATNTIQKSKSKKTYRLLRDTGKLLSITHYKRSANQNHIEVSLHTGQTGHD